MPPLTRCSLTRRPLLCSYMILIPRTMSVPCAAKQMFTTLHDNQEQACILVLYG